MRYPQMKKAATVLFFCLLAGCARKAGETSLTEQRLGARGDVYSGQVSVPIKVDIIQVTAPVVAGNGTVIRSVLQVGSNVQDMSSSHYGWTNNNAYSTGQTTISGYNIATTAYCPDASCRRYYVLVDVFNGSQKVMQFGLKYDFDNTGNRYFTTRDAGRLFQSVGEFLDYMDYTGNFH